MLIKLLDFLGRVRLYTSAGLPFFEAVGDAVKKWGLALAGTK